MGQLPRSRWLEILRSRGTGISRQPLGVCTGLAWRFGQWEAAASVASFCLELWRTAWRRLPQKQINNTDSWTMKSSNRPCVLNSDSNYQAYEKYFPESSDICTEQYRVTIATISIVRELRAQRTLEWSPDDNTGFEDCIVYDSLGPYRNTPYV